MENCRLILIGYSEPNLNTPCKLFDRFRFFRTVQSYLSLIRQVKTNSLTEKSPFEKMFILHNYAMAWQIEISRVNKRTLSYLKI